MNDEQWINHRQWFKCTTSENVSHLQFREFLHSTRRVNTKDYFSTFYKNIYLCCPATHKLTGGGEKANKSTYNFAASPYNCKKFKYKLKTNNSMDKNY